MDRLLVPRQNNSETVEVAAPIKKTINLFIDPACPELSDLFRLQQKSPDDHRARGLRNGVIYRLT